MPIISCPFAYTLVIFERARPSVLAKIRPWTESHMGYDDYAIRSLVQALDLQDDYYTAKRDI